MGVKDAPRNVKESVSFRKSVAASEEDRLHERIKGAGTIEGIRVRFYSGQQLDLRVHVYVVHKGGLTESLITYNAGADQYLSGDDEVVQIDCVVSVENDDELWVWYQNADAVNSYNLVVDVAIDYYGGNQRVGVIV